MSINRALASSDVRAPLPLVWGALLVLLMLTPLPFGGNRPWAWSVLASGCALLLAAWSVALWRRPAIGLVWRPLVAVPLLLFAAVVGWILVQAWLPVPESLAHPLWRMTADALGQPVTPRISVAPAAMPAALLRLLSYTVVFWLALQLCRTPDRARTLLACLAASAGAYALYGIVNYGAGNDYLLWYPKWAYRDDLTATFVNRNSFATYAGISLLVCIALAVDAFRRRWRLGDRSAARIARLADAMVGAPLGWTLLALTVAVAWLQSHSRMGFVAGGAGLIVFYLLLRSAGILRHRGLAPLAILAIAAGLMLVSGDVTLERLLSTAEVDRAPLFALIAVAIGDAPWVGTGYGSFASVFQIYRDSSIPGTADLTEAHNSYLELALELGVPAALVLIAAVLVVVGACLGSVYRLPSGRLVPALAVSAAVLAGIHATLDFSLQIPAVACLLAALLGAGLAPSCKLRSARAASR